MKTYSTIDIIKILQNREIILFTLSDFAKLFNLDNQQTIYKKIARLEKKQIIKKLIKGKYQFLLTKTNNFHIANFMYSPSYISLESALSFHSIITRFPYQITSITPRSTKLIDLGDQEYKYTHLASFLFWGYEKKENFLMAEPEKALLDYIYLTTKGLRNPNLDEMDLSKIRTRKIQKYAKIFGNKQVSNVLNRLFEKRYTNLMNHPLSKYQNQINQIARDNHINYLALFGSTARGDNKLGSDVDLLVNFNKRLSLLDLIQVERHFSDTFNRPVDLIPKDSLNKYVKPYVMKDLITLYDQR